MSNFLTSECPRTNFLCLPEVDRTRAGMVPWWSSACPKDSAVKTGVTFAVLGLLYLAVGTYSLPFGN